MARSGRSYPSRPIVVKNHYKLDASLSLGAFETVSEWPPLNVVTPNADVLLGAFETVSEWPPLTISYGQTASLPPFETVSEWPPLSISVPIRPGDAITQAGQVELNGTLWGPDTDVGVLLPVQGWRSTPNIDNLNVERPTQHGAWEARKRSQQRLVTIKLQPNSADDPTLIDDLLAQVDSVTGIAPDDTPIPLVVKGYGDPQLVYGQVIDRDVQMDGDYNVGLPTVSVLFACADPRRYNILQTGADIAAGATGTLANGGNVTTFPTIRINGPVTNPSLSNATNSRTIAFTLTVGVGEQLVIDPARGNALLDGESVLSTLTLTSDPVASFVLARGNNEITFTVSSGSPLATFLWRDAWL